MIIRKLRLERGWSQEQLAEISGLSVRTIQRIERGRLPSLESLKSLAAVFEVEISGLKTEADMKEHASITSEEERALIYVRDIKGFYTHVIIYIVVVAGLFALNIIRGSNHLWAVWPAAGWGIGILFHALNVYEVFNLFGPSWEKRQVEKRLKKNR